MRGGGKKREVSFSLEKEIWPLPRKSGINIKARLRAKEEGGRKGWVIIESALLD